MSSINDIIKTIDEANEQFASRLSSTEKRLLNEVLNLVKELSMSNGRINSSVENLKLISKIRTKLNQVVLNKEYMRGVREVANSFNSIYQAQMQNPLIPQKGLSNSAKTKFELVKELALDNTISGLTQAGIEANVTDKISSIITRSITSGGMYADLVTEMTDLLRTDENSVGALTRYAKTFVSTALSQYAGQNNKLMTDDLDIEWFQYVGSNIETTREFCEHLTEKRFVHKSEIPDIVSGLIDGHQCELNQRTGLPKGMIEGTNEDNFQINTGGWGCRHQLMPTGKASVPKEVRERIESELISNGQKEKLPFEEYKGKFVEIEKGEALDKLKNLKTHEESYSFLKDGSVYYKRGGEFNVAFNKEERQLLRGADLYHNHPEKGVASLSKEDILFLLKNDLNSISSVADGKSFTIKRTSRTEYDEDRFNDVYERIAKKTEAIAWKKGYNDDDFYNSVNKDVAKEFGLTFTVRPLSLQK